MTITKREVIVSVAIIAVMLIIGLVIGDKLEDLQNDKNAVYWKAQQIEDPELFQYGMDTSIGNAFVYGTLQAEDPVTYQEIGGKYMYIKRIKERYTMHTRTVTYKVGKTTQTRVECYWTWDRVGSEEKTCRNIKFLGIEFDSKKINLPDTEYIETVKESGSIRYKYYGVEEKLKGTLYTKLSNGSISDQSNFYKEKKITETVEMLTAGSDKVIFSVLWAIIIALVVIGFYYLDNRWLND